MCPECGTSIMEGPDGWYITECPHFPMEERRTAKKKVTKYICDHANQYKKCEGCQHHFPHEEIVIFNDVSCKSLGPCGVSISDYLEKEVQCVPLEEK